MKLSSLLLLCVLSLLIEVHGAHATWAPGKEPAHLKEGDPLVTNVVEHPGGVKKVWYEYAVQNKHGNPGKKTGVQIFQRGKLIDVILDFHGDNTVTKVDHTTGEEVRVSTVLPSLQEFVKNSAEEAEKMRLFRRFTKYSIFEGYEEFKKNVSANSKDPCPSEMKEELRKACLTFAANSSTYELSHNPDPSIDPQKKCEPGILAFPSDPFYKAVCIGTWLGLQGDKCGASGLNGSNSRLAFVVCRATLAARQEMSCKEALPAESQGMDHNWQISLQHGEVQNQAINMSASEVKHLFLGVCGGLKKVYAGVAAKNKLVHCFKESKVATDHMTGMHHAAGQIHQEIIEKENQKNLANSSSSGSRSIAELVALIPEPERTFYCNEIHAKTVLKKAGNKTGTFLVRRSMNGNMHVVYVDANGNYVPVKLSDKPDGWMDALEKLDVWKDGTLKTILPFKKIK